MNVMSGENCFTKVFLSKFPLIVKSTIDGLIGNGYTTKELLLLLDLAEDLPQMSDISMAQKSVLRRILTEFQKLNKEVNDEFDRRVAVGLRDGSASVVSNDVFKSDVNSGSQRLRSVPTCRHCLSAIRTTDDQSMPSTDTTTNDSIHTIETTSGKSLSSISSANDQSLPSSSAHVGSESMASTACISLTDTTYEVIFEKIPSKSQPLIQRSLDSNFSDGCMSSAGSSTTSEEIASTATTLSSSVAAVDDSSGDSEDMSFSFKRGTDRRRKRQRISLSTMSSTDDTSDGQSSEDSTACVKRMKGERVYYMCTPRPLSKMSKEFKRVVPKFVKFGSFKTNASAVLFDKLSLTLVNATPNDETIGSKCNIMIPFTEIQELVYCLDPKLPLLYFKPIQTSNDKIQESMFLGNTSANGLRLDINSDDYREKYIKIVFNKIFGHTLVSVLRQYFRMTYMLSKK